MYVPDYARSETQQLIERLGALLKHDSDRNALVGSIPKLRQALRSRILQPPNRGKHYLPPLPIQIIPPNTIWRLTLQSILWKRRGR